MSGAFSAKVDISTREAVAGLRAARAEAKLFGDSLNDLDKIVRANKQNLILAAQQFTALVAAQERAVKVSAALAKVKIDEARAQGIANVATAKAAQLNASAANQHAQGVRATQQGNLAVVRTQTAVTQAQTAATNATTRQANAAQRASQSQLQLHDSLSNTRYLMYDVGATYGVIAAGLMAIPAATAAVAMAYQKDFAQVERVSNDAVSKAALPELRESLKDIATDIPVAFGELSRITQLGAQMGVANTKLSEFTETTAKFVAVTGISADAGSQLFGRMETSFTEDVAKYPDFFERVGSAIAHVGAETVATDPEIAALLNQIGPLGAQAGFTAAEITGLSAALASVRVQPELARGTLTRIFGQLNRDVAEGSPRLAEYGKMMGLTADQAGKLWKSDPSQFFQGLIKGLNQTHVNGGNLTTTLDKLGIKASRDVSAITKLAVGYNVLEKSMNAANTGFSEGTALNDMSKPIFETAVAKLQKMANAWQNLADTLGASSLGPLAELIDIATNLAVGLDNLIDDVPMIGSLITALMGMAAVTAIFLGFKAAQAFVIAGFVGFQQASTRGIGASMSMTGVLRQAAQTMLITKGATDAQSRSLIGQAGAWKALQIAVSTSSDRLAATATVSNNLDASTRRTTSGVRAFGSGLLGMVGGPIGIAIIALSALAGHFVSTAVEAQQAGEAIADGMAQGTDSGMRAIADTLKSKKVGMMDSLGVANWGKDITKVASEVGVGFEQIVGSISKGKNGIAEFDKVLDKAAKNKGFANFQDYFATHSEDAEKLNYLKSTVHGYIDAAASSADSTKVADDALNKLGVTAKDTGEIIDDEATTPIEEMTKALKALNDEVFGTINAEADLQSALAKIGEGLHESGNFRPTNAAGRENLQNFQDAMEKARTYYTQLMADGTLNAEQAAQGYADFVQGLINEIRVQGGDTSGIEALAQATAQKFATVIGGNPASVPVEADTTKFEDDVRLLSGTPMSATLTVGMDKSNADANMMLLAQNISKITGIPYEVVMDAMTDPAHAKAGEIEALLVAVADGTYVAAVDADTTAAVTNIQNFLAFARTELAHLQTELNGKVGYGDGEGSLGTAQKAQYAAIAAPNQRRAVPKGNGAAKVSIPAPRTTLGQNLGGVADGYNKAAEAAKKAGKSAKEAAKDIASGIDDAVRAAEDYGNRLKTALTSAFNQQYGLTKATDDYHSALNAINKKRDEEIKQLDELKQKVIDLNNERNKELITANKAKIEQNISLKYGEVDRAADYGQQAKTALDNAAAKQKDIAATNAQSKELSDGIGALTGYSDAAIANRNALRDLESKTLDMIAAYAAQGHSQEEVRAYAQQLTAQFQTDVGQIGFNIAAVGNLQGSMGRYIDTIDRVPQFVPTKVEADTDQAASDIGGIADQLAALPQQTVLDVQTRVSYGVRMDPAGDMVGDQKVWESYNTSTGASTGIKFFNEGGLVPGTSPSDPRADNMMAKVDGKGLIGIRSREFIQPEPAVDYYGQDFMEAIRTMKLPKYYRGGSPSGSTGGGGSAGSGVVDLGAATLAAMAEMRQEIKLYTENRVIAESANNGNRELAAEGRN